MYKIQIGLVTIEDIRKFVTILAKYTVDLDLQSGRYTVDARSLMGIFSLDLMKPLDFIIHSDDEKIINAVLADVSEWIVADEHDCGCCCEGGADLVVGLKVKILKTADKYVTGEKIPDRIKGAIDEVMQISKDGNSVLLKGIYSWVWLKDIIPAVVEDLGFKVGDKVKVLKSAKKYATGEIIPDRIKGLSDEIMQLSKDGKSVLLKGIYSWVWATDVEKV